MTPNPVNKSFLSNNKYQFVIDRLPNLVFFLQSITLPSMTLGTVVTANPYVQLQTPSNLISFSTLTLNYIVDENMESWFEIYNWMINLGNPESADKLGNLTNVPGNRNSVTSNASLLVKTNSNNGNIKFTFFDIFPTDLGEITFTSTEGQEFLTSTITFNYTHYRASKI